VTLPKDIPQANFWSFTLYDTMSRSMLDTPQHFPRAGSQSFPSPAPQNFYATGSERHRSLKTSLRRWLRLR